MSDPRVDVNNLSPARVASGYRLVRGTAGGAQYVADETLALGIEGRLIGAHFGTLTTPLATAATTAIATLRPMVWVRVPDGTAIVPLSVRILVESQGATTQGEILIGRATSDVGNGTSSAGTSGPLSLNSALPYTSLCTCRQLATGDVSADFDLELKRFSFAASAVNQDFNYTPLADGEPVVLRGASTLLVYIGGNAVNFYAQVKWLEVPETSVS